MGIQRFFKIRILGHIFADIFGWCSVTNRALIQKIVHDCNIADMVYQPIINFWVCLTHICFREKMMVVFTVCLFQPIISNVNNAITLPILWRCLQNAIHRRSDNQHDPPHIGLL